MRPSAVLGSVVLSLACATPGTTLTAPAAPAAAALASPAVAASAPSPAPAPADAPEPTSSPAIVQVGVTGTARATVKPALAEAPGKTRLQGIDISHYQPSVKWESVNKASAAFVFIKATEATSEDTRFESYWSGAKKAGIPRGAYHFFHPKIDVQAQVESFTKRVSPDPGELPVVVDVEEYKALYAGLSCEQAASKLRAFSQGVEKALGHKPIIYTNHETWQKSFCNHPYFRDHMLWLAKYTLSTSEPKPPTGWKQWQFWQYTGSGEVTGIPGTVDQSYFNGSVEELKALLKME
ncbi:glycoside hydrolase family 25 protein [Corallococcus llansteffanensis]|uniref:glycoside hydrolase family 25 protein n=1 Tax=Corallococcus llansteffanensis TaxID=2316731 RepID=UPI0011C36FFB|nr:GH25 family lysozyme [Corallococcus llansteffanensis]